MKRRIVAMMEKVPLLRFHLDSGHAKLEGGYDGGEKYLDGLGPKLLHVHRSRATAQQISTCRWGPSAHQTKSGPQHLQKLKAPATTARSP